MYIYNYISDRTRNGNVKCNSKFKLAFLTLIIKSFINL